MTAVCISSTRGVDVFKPSNYTIATSAPTSSFDFELRYQLLDAQSNSITKKDLVIFLEALLHELQVGNGQFFKLSASGTNFVGPQI